MIGLSLAVGALAFVLLLSSASDLLSAARLVVGMRRRQPPADRRAPRFLFLVPAHDEEDALPACLGSLARAGAADWGEVVVIADNCADRTAAVAWSAGVRCLVRTDPATPGKPRALAWALTQLPYREFDAVVIVDADTEVDREFAARLACAAPLRNKALQPFNGVLNRGENALTRMAALLSAADHELAYALKTRAGLNVPLSAGMCLGSDVLAAYGWTAYSTCEDWELYALLTARGVRIEGVPDARIFAQEASTLRASATQRRRWTGGKLAVLRTQLWPVIRSGKIGVAQKLDAIAELMRPGPVVHLCLVAAAGGLTLLLRLSAAPWLLGALLVSLLRPAAYTIAATARTPEPGRAIAAFAFLPLYAAWRAWTVLVTLASLGDKAWVRTARPSRSELPYRP